MLSEPLTLYKLMVLYMLRRVKSPMTNTQISEFFLEKEYTTYFTLQQALSELLDSHLIKTESTNSCTFYKITREGEETLSFFGKKISDAITEDINLYLEENKVRLRDEVGVISDYYKSTNHDYTVHCEVREGKSTLIELNLSVPEKSQAEYMCSRWSDKSQEIYAFIMHELMKQ